MTGKRLFAIIAVLLLGPTYKAEVVYWQGFDIHYTTLNSMLIPNEVALAHGIVRSKRRIITNIAVRKGDRSVTAKLSGTAVNLLSQLSRMEFSEVTEAGAIYYLSNQLVDERDRLVFNIDIQPTDHADTFHLKFIRQYH
ncbi:MAG: DUF4426 domain-containing protein [bacterium]|nr:DUF4426 domain-containing protein [Gammaproteobacteria bacterium]HIL99051.1 DUF4426 domain-containing protein [Pseudomonadales bacterium]